MQCDRAKCWHPQRIPVGVTQCLSSAIGHSCINSCRCRTTGLGWNKSFCGDPSDICTGNGMQIHVRSDIVAALTDIWNRVWIERYGTSGRPPLRTPELVLLKLSRGADPSRLVCNSGLHATGCELFVTSGAQASYSGGAVFDVWLTLFLLYSSFLLGKLWRITYNEPRPLLSTL